VGEPRLAGPCRFGGAIVSGVLGIFDGRPTVLQAVAGLRTAGRVATEAFAPFLDEELVAQVAGSRSQVHRLTLGGAVAGAVLGLWLTIATTLQWPLLITGGKPLVSIPPFLVIVFTLVILLGSVGTWIGFVWFAQKSRRRELPYDTRFSDGHFGLWVECQADELASVSALLRELGAVECRAF
jgi:hypothetical protein